MARVIAIANQKGGVGKTTSTLNLGAALQEQEYRVLVIDLDPQASLTMSLGISPEDQELTIYSAIRAAIEAAETPSLMDIVLTTASGLDLAPANIELSAAELDLNKATMGELILQELVEGVRERYDFILIDCPPSLGLLTINALSAADEVMIPLQADYLALKGVNLLMQTISTIQRKINRKLRIAGVFITMADTRTLHTQEVLASAQQALANQIHMFEAVIKMNVRVKEAPITGESILTMRAIPTQHKPTGIWPERC
jgi:chromosome partitioning protein